MQDWLLSQFRPMEWIQKLFVKVLQLRDKVLFLSNEIVDDLLSKLSLRSRARGPLSVFTE